MSLRQTKTLCSVAAKTEGVSQNPHIKSDLRSYYVKTKKALLQQKPAQSI